jgi:hypothetical protein
LKKVLFKLFKMLKPFKSAEIGIETPSAAKAGEGGVRVRSTEVPRECFSSDYASPRRW